MNVTSTGICICHMYKMLKLIRFSSWVLDWKGFWVHYNFWAPKNGSPAFSWLLKSISLIWSLLPSTHMRAVIEMVGRNSKCQFISPAFQKQGSFLWQIAHGHCCFTKLKRIERTNGERIWLCWNNILVNPFQLCTFPLRWTSTPFSVLSGNNGSPTLKHLDHTTLKENSISCFLT